MIGIVGSGLAGFTAYVTLRRKLEPGEIAVFGTDPDPAAVWRVRAAAIRQREMRSESDGHCVPTSFPGLAVRDAVRRRTPVPLVASLFDRYHPSVDEFLSHVEELRARSGWDESFRHARIERVRAVDGGFEHGWARDPLLRHLVEKHGLETCDRWLVLAPDSAVPALTDETRTLALAGVQAQWTFPAADTLVGAKYAARGFLRRVEACRTR